MDLAEMLQWTMVLVMAATVGWGAQAAEEGAPPDWKVTDVRASSPYRIFYEGEDIRLTVRVRTEANLGDEVSLRAHQLLHRVPDDLPKDARPARNALKSGWENSLGPVFAAGRATVTQDGEALILDCDVEIERLGAIRLAVARADREYPLADFLHVLPRNGVAPENAVFTLNSVRKAKDADARFALYKRLGIQLVRAGGRSWERDTMHLDWAHYDELLAAMKKHGMRAYFIIGGASIPITSHLPGREKDWQSLIRYRGGRSPETTPGTECLDVWAEQMGELAKRFRGYARGYEFFNEPWELGSVSGTISGGAHIRRLIEWGAPAIKAADPEAKILAACSGPNAQDSFLPYPKITDLMDVLTIHTYSLGSAGAFLAPRYELEIWDTESWEPMMERNLPMKVAHQVHQGYGGIKPMNQVKTPAEGGNPWQASWAIAVTAQRMLEGMRPAGHAIRGVTPVVLLYEGRGHAAAFVHGTAEYYGSKFYRPTPHRQIEQNADCSGWAPWMIGHYVVPAEGLTVRDVYGNRLESEGDVYRIPLGQSGRYVTADSIERLRRAMEAGVLEGVKPFTIAIRDITERLAPGAEVRVEVTNVYPVAQTARVSVDGHGVIGLEGAVQERSIEPGATASFRFPIAAVGVHKGNAFRVTATAESGGQACSYTENINVAMIARGTVVVDGDLDDWDAIGAVRVRIADQKTYTDPLAEYQKIPIAEISEQEQGASVVEARAAWDDAYFYFSAEVLDRDEERRESNAYGDRHARHGWPNQQVYLGRPQLTGHAGDAIMLSFNTNETHKKYWDYIEQDHPLARVYPYPDTDYEFEVYPVKYNERRDALYRRALGKKRWRSYPESEVWRLYDPKMIFRHHAYPFNLPSVRQKYDQGLVIGARSAIERRGNMWVYEVAIPWDQLQEVKPAPGKRVKFAFYTRNNGGHGMEYARGKSVSATNTVTFHPMWESFWSNETEWGFVD